MRARALGRMAWQNLRRARRQSLLSIFGITVGVSSLCFFLALSAGVRDVVLGRVFHVDRLEVEPAKATFDIPLLGGGPRLIDEKQVTALRALPGVRSVAPRMRLAFPAKAWGGAELFGSNRYMEVLGEGLDPSALAGESVGPEPFDDLEAGPHASCNSDGDCTTRGEYCAWDVHQCQRPVPLVISKFIVELYNSSFAPSHGLPRISDFLASRFAGFTFTVELGTSFMGQSAAHGVPRQRRVMLVGVSDRAIPIGLSFPLPYVRRWNAEYAGAQAAAGYTSVTLEVADRSAVTSVAAAVRGLGLTIASSGAEQAGLAITLLTLLFALVSLAIVAVAVTNIAHTFFRAVSERRREIGVLRAVGASRGDVVSLMLAEAAAIGLAGGVLGVALAAGAAALCDLAARRWVPDFPFKPESFFQFGAVLVVGAVGFAVVACVVGAMLPARAAARLEPAAALTSG